ncbi:MAG TPA: ribosome-associated translation inhibitor RaiA [Phycisphaerae bacterium]|jgi:ribosomal subunit interface protein|nr:ribosome-associated translation inhibitor RaiA [Phycisphaerae bacterium]HOB76578.1 ribosome-associated translation inhibitor RaiA [Phycisphaerae bacterium]HOJ56781.1 ribosome-associated translation inhibitor RaiA [Phycisphaerae bacterium]HOL28542.1 ribosome-associated translation inhibitor RaiA [Phycisphaerae bacterium]HPP22978.1 ribosome-associated translation inhibitor RaiA [Phycisphaerae bacterium]
MVLRIHGHHLEVSEALDAHITERFKSALDQLDHMVQEITVRLEDVNGPKGGVDKRCHATVYLRAGGTVVVDEVNSDMYAAASLVADRLKNVIGRKVQKIRER